MSSDSSLRSAITSTTRHIGLLSTYPPKLCGLATFAAALEGGLVRHGHHVEVVRIDDGEDLPRRGPSVVAELVNGSAASVRAAARVLSRNDLAIIQHEYGIFGGADGQEIIDLLEQLTVPSIVVLHTVPLHPTEHQHSLLGEIGDLADRVVVMTSAARDRLIDLYPINEDKVVTIYHGASNPTTAQLEEATHLNGTRPQLLTWGLIGPGKGIEHVIDALALIGEQAPRPRYTVAGVTHPKVFARDGNQYRNALIQRSHIADLGDRVMFDDTYRNLRQLTSFVAASSVVVLPYDSRDQVTSGVLVDAIAAGRPVIATAFPHAVELLGSGAGIVVPHGDAEALADAITAVLTDPDLWSAMATEALRLAPSFSWASIAGQYADLTDQLIGAKDAVAI